jgi:hypothetical protein
MYAGRVNQDDLGIGTVDDAENARPRGLRLGRDNGYFPANQAIDQSALPDVWPS